LDSEIKVSKLIFLTTLFSALTLIFTKENATLASGTRGVNKRLLTKFVTILTPVPAVNKATFALETDLEGRERQDKRKEEIRWMISPQGADGYDPGGTNITV